MDNLKKILNAMPPEQALELLSQEVRLLLAHMDDDSRTRFLVKMIGDAGVDRVAGLVDLWLAECMDEGVDPTRMCQSLVDKVARSKQLTAVADPDVLVLFEDWLDELEHEARALINASPSRDPLAAARELGLSESGAAFLAAKLIVK